MKSVNTIPEFRAGKAISAASLNAMLQALKHRPVESQKNRVVDFFEVKIGAHTSAGKYAFTEQVWDNDTNAYVAAGGGYSNLDLGHIQEINAVETVAVDSYALCLLFVDLEGNVHPVFAAGGGGGGSGIPDPTQTGQVYQAVTDNVGGWQFPVAHSVD